VNGAARQPRRSYLTPPAVALVGKWRVVATKFVDVTRGHAR
jgi:hypothetical protein